MDKLTETAAARGFHLIGPDPAWEKPGKGWVLKCTTCGTTRSLGTGKINEGRFTCQACNQAPTAQPAPARRGRPDGRFLTFQGQSRSIRDCATLAHVSEKSIRQRLHARDSGAGGAGDWTDEQIVLGVRRSQSLANEREALLSASDHGRAVRIRAVKALDDLRTTLEKEFQGWCREMINTIIVPYIERTTGVSLYAEAAAELCPTPALQPTLAEVLVTLSPTERMAYETALSYLPPFPGDELVSEDEEYPGWTLRQWRAMDACSFRAAGTAPDRLLDVLGCWGIYWDIATGEVRDEKDVLLGTAELT